MAEKTYTEEARNLIRAKIRAYMAENKIKLSAVPAAMAKAAGREEKYYPISNFRRFMKKIGTTEDLNVQLYDEFINSLPPPATLSALTLSLGAFHQPAAATNAPPPPALPPETYTIYIQPAAATIITQERYSQITFTATPTANIFEVTETILNPDRLLITDPFQLQRRPSFEGAALFYDHAAILYMRNRSTRLPRTVYFKPAPPHPNERAPVFDLTVTEIGYQARTADDPPSTITFQARLPALREMH